MSIVYNDVRKAAQKLRRGGASYGEINKKLGVAKSTLSYWLKGILLKPEDRKRLYTKQIGVLSQGPKSQKNRRAKEVEQIIKEAEKEIDLPLPIKTLRLVGAAIYWGEGSKGKRAQITNSDPCLILFMVRWIESIFKIPAINLKARLNIYPQQDEFKIKKFWSDLTGIPLKNFGKSYVKPESKGYKKNNLYYGTMRVEVPKSTNIRHKIFGWIKGVVGDLNLDVQLTQRKWQSLAKISRPSNLFVKTSSPRNSTVE
jgi:transposase-like protein